MVDYGKAVYKYSGCNECIVYRHVKAAVANVYSIEFCWFF